MDRGGSESTLCRISQMDCVTKPALPVHVHPSSIDRAADQRHSSVQACVPPRHFEPSALYCFRKAQRSSCSLSFLMPGKTILVSGTLARGSMMYSWNVTSPHTMSEFLLASQYE